ncbi:PH domain-containing protein [Halobacillus shinanisalinarum]|uniref:PH domain-containing protein n=1 Tax=Halobacillus shinanisalinarum TaxID=2932258 RepID=A0ABY4GXB1_9BACI|nr:PH domain-containing protein [Halobacillus shinanisalinarum]UOQ92656.1 PH domain-containing protein [Halobacillus shinanisalinarum]
MREPSQRISRRALTLWRIYGYINTGIVGVIAIAIIILTNLYSWPLWPSFVIGVLFVLEIIFSIWLIPSIKWDRLRYEVRDQEIEYQYGLFIVKRILVPMVRVQHVDTEQGPLLRKYRLATISISTAATVHKIPALDEREAEGLRNTISSLARVAEDDV